MASRRQVSGVALHEELAAGIDPFPHPELRNNRFAARAAEIEHLAENHYRLAATHVALKQDFSAAQREVEKLKEHIRSTQTESDIQVRLLHEKIAKMDVEEAHLDARSLVSTNMELTGKIQELKKARADVKKLPAMHAVLNSLKKEQQTLRKAFEYEKGLNIEKVAQMKVMEKELIEMANEAEKLRAQVAIAEKRAQLILHPL